MRYLEEINEQKMWKEEVEEKNMIYNIRRFGHIQQSVIGNSTHFCIYVRGGVRSQGWWGVLMEMKTQEQDQLPAPIPL